MRRPGRRRREKLPLCGGFDHRRAAAGPPEKGDTLVSDQPKKNSFFDKLATFIVDKRDLIFFLYIIAIIASIFTQSWVRVCNDLTEYLPVPDSYKRNINKPIANKHPSKIASKRAQTELARVCRA